jgi:hypothetical protein
MNWFEDLPVVPAAILVIGGFVVVSLLFVRIVARFVPADILKEHNDLTGFIFAVVGVMYAVILAFVAVGVWERFVDAETRTYDEASSLITVYRDASMFRGGAEIRKDLRAYVDTEIHLGWPALESGTHSLPATNSVEILSREVRATMPSNTREQGLYPLMVTAMDQALVDRDARVAEDASGLNGVMWFVVYAGGFITIGFSYLFGFRQTMMQTAMIGTLALLIGLIIFLTSSLDFPFRGAIRVGPDAFERAQYVFGRIDATDPLRGMHTR